tara:strand:+ start:203 stop:724 length:522 start_codon:yes stop_codon:yes gene_type:complete
MKKSLILFIVFTSFGVSAQKSWRSTTAKEYFDRGNSKYELKNYRGARVDYTKAIELDSNYVKAYYYRGNVNANLDSYYRAVYDYTKFIELHSYYQTAAYFNSGNLKRKLKDNSGAIADYTRAIAINPIKINAYYNRGISNEMIGEMDAACIDWRKAAKLGHKNSAKRVKDQCN